jgi:hypothetical protein
MTDHGQLPGSIASYVAKTLGVFRDLKKVLSKATDSDNFPGPGILSDFILKIENDSTRFKMWAGNQTAHKSGPASLDYRLREATHLQKQVIYLLKDLCESLADIITTLSDSPYLLDEDEDEQGAQDREFQDDKASPLSTDEDGEFDFSDDPGPLPISRLSTLLVDVGEAIDCLLRLSVAIENPAPHERLCKLEAESPKYSSFHESYDLGQPEEKGKESEGEKSTDSASQSSDDRAGLPTLASITEDLRSVTTAWTDQAEPATSENQSWFLKVPGSGRYFQSERFNETDSLESVGQATARDALGMLSPQQLVEGLGNDGKGDLFETEKGTKPQSTEGRQTHLDESTREQSRSQQPLDQSQMRGETTNERSLEDLAGTSAQYGERIDTVANLEQERDRSYNQYHEVCPNPNRV